MNIFSHSSLSLNQNRLICNFCNCIFPGTIYLSQFMYFRKIYVQNRFMTKKTFNFETILTNSTTNIQTKYIRTSKTINFDYSKNYSVD